MFFLFFRKKKRKNQREETLSGRGMNAGQRAALPLHPLSIFPCGAFLSEKPRKIFFAGKRKCRRRAGAAAVSGAGLWLSFLVLFSFSGKKREQTKPEQNKTKQNSGRGFVWLALRMESAGMIGTTDKNQSYRSIGFH